MKWTKIFIPLFLISYLQADIGMDLFEDFKGDITEYRIYPRLEKADNYIAQNNISKAKELLFKILEIDPKNVPASKRIVVLCMKEDDYICARKYVKNVTPTEYAKYLEANIAFHDKAYQQAFEAASSIKATAKLGAGAQSQNNLTLLKSAILVNNIDATNKYIDPIMQNQFKIDQCPAEALNVITLLFEQKMFSQASNKTELYMSKCPKKISDTQLITWAELFEKGEQFDAAKKVIGGIEDTKVKNEQLLSLYQNMNDHAKAIETMETIHHDDPTDSNKARLAYLYENAHMDNKKMQLYAETYQTNKNPEDLKKLLYETKEPSRQFELLKTYYSYEELSPTERYNFSITLIDFYKQEGNTTQIIPILDHLNTLNLNEKEKIELSYQYHSYGQNEKSIAILENLYQADPKQEYKEKLLYLYADKKYAQQREALLLSRLPQKCDKTTVLALANLKHKTSKVMHSLESYAPYACLTKKEQFNVTRTVSEYHQNSRQDSKATQTINKTAGIKMQNATQKQKTAKSTTGKEPTPQSKHNTYSQQETQTAYNLIYQKHYDEAIVHIKNALKYQPKNAVLYEQLGQLYYQQGEYKKAGEAYENAAKFDQKSGYYESLGYVHIKLDEKEDAINSFKKSIDLSNQEEPKNINKLYQLKSSIAELDRQFFGYLNYGVRLDEYDMIQGAISPILAANYNGFAALELHYKPEIFKDYASVYVKALSGVRDQSLALESETWQPSFGLRFQPYKDEKFYLFAERFVKGGDQSREETMLRASWELFDGYDFFPTKTEYWWKHLYLDGVYYLENETYNLYANYEHGYIWKLGYEDAVMPYVCTSIAFSNDNYEKQSLNRFDIGGGVSYLFWREESLYKSHKYIGRFKIEFRSQYHGDAVDNNSVRSMLEFFF